MPQNNKALKIGVWSLLDGQNHIFPDMEFIRGVRYSSANKVYEVSENLMTRCRDMD